MALPLIAVHISDGIVSWPWIAGGFGFMALALAFALPRVPQETIPRLGVFTAVFFVASQVHIPLGPVSVHLILNGLIGILLGFRCVIAIAVGLALQAFLAGHGGTSTVGINFAVVSLPALAAGRIYRGFPFRDRIVPVAALGSATALATVLLNALVLELGAEGDWSIVVRTSVVLHLPVIALEGGIVACALRVLAKARPEWLGLPADQFPSGNTSEKGTSH
jgi:cobalt/nickel transport system permease protein